MHPELNPFTPGSGLRPPELAGREAEVAAFDLLVARSLNRRSAASLVLHGYRGVGKTVLLNAMRDQAEKAGWLCIDVEAQDSQAGSRAIRQRIGRKLHLASDLFKNGKSYSTAVRRALGTLTGFSLSLGVVSIETAREPSNGRAQSGVLEVDLEELVEDFAEALHENSAAIGVFIDEMQDVDDELIGALLTVQNRAGQKGIPFYVVGAGLPTLPARLAQARSYAERLFEYRLIDAAHGCRCRSAPRTVKPAQLLYRRRGPRHTSRCRARLPVLPAAVRSGGVEHDAAEGDHTPRCRACPCVGICAVGSGIFSLELGSRGPR